MSSCVICQIVDKQVPAWVIYQDGQVICFLPKEVYVYGHTVVAPIAHVADLYTAPTALLEHLIVVVQKLAAHYNKRIGSTGVNLLHASGTSAQQSVPHLHVHLIPRFDSDGLDAWPHFPSERQYDKDQILEALRWNECDEAA